MFRSDEGKNFDSVVLSELFKPLNAQKFKLLPLSMDQSAWITDIFEISKPSVIEEI